MVIIERRRYRRLAVGAEVEYKVLDKEEAGDFSTTSKNISGGGIRLIVFERLKPGDILELKFFMPRFRFLKLKPKRFINAKGKVIWINELKVDQEKSDKIYDIGIEFINLSEASRVEIEKYVKSRIPKSGGRKV